MRTNSLLVDCGATTAKSKFMNFDKDFDPDNHYDIGIIILAIELAGGRTDKVTSGRGDTSGKLLVTLMVMHARNVMLKNVLYVSSYKQDIVSVQAATEAGASFNIKLKCAELKSSGAPIFNIDKKGRLYFLNSTTSCKSSSHTIHE